jgi:hypothetical protein
MKAVVVGLDHVSILEAMLLRPHNSAQAVVIIPER